MGINPVALLLLALAFDVPINVDVGDEAATRMPDGRQVSAWTHGDDVIELMIPLTHEVYHTADMLLVPKDLLPETVVIAAGGRPATLILDHPALEGRTVRGPGGPFGNHREILLDPTARGRWGELTQR